MLEGFLRCSSSATAGPYIVRQARLHILSAALRCISICWFTFLAQCLPPAKGICGHAPSEKFSRLRAPGEAGLLHRNRSIFRWGEKQCPKCGCFGGKRECAAV